MPPSPACTHIGGGKSHCRVWRSATSYDSRHRPVGTIRPGTNYFYCQVQRPQRETYGEWTNVWWAKTDDDSGNSGVSSAMCISPTGRTIGRCRASRCAEGATGPTTRRTPLAACHAPQATHLALYREPSLVIDSMRDQ